MGVPLIDLAAQQQELKTEIDARISKVLSHGKYIMGPEVVELEEKLAGFSGAKHAITCSNGTDALALLLMAKGVKPGDAVLLPSFTFCSTAEVVAWLGATAIFVDVEDTYYNICPQSLEQGIQKARELKLKPAGIIAVDLFGHPADYPAIQTFAEAHDLWVLADAAQGFGCSIDGVKSGALTEMMATSFFPAKPLGCYGDGGAVCVNDDALAEVVRSLRVHGKGADKYDNVRIGMNGRLDTLQASILLPKLAVYEKEITLRNEVANRYTTAFSSVPDIKTPEVKQGCVSVWAQYTIQLPNVAARDNLAAALKEKQIGNAIYYPKPLHQQTAYKHYPTVTGKGLDVSERLSQTVLSLPMYPYLSESQQQEVIDAVLASAERKAA